MALKTKKLVVQIFLNSEDEVNLAESVNLTNFLARMPMIRCWV